MPQPIDPKRFSGHSGYVVTESPDGTPGVLDEHDEVRRISQDRGTPGRVDEGDTLSERVGWDNADFAAARDRFSQDEARLAAMRKLLSGSEGPNAAPARPSENTLSDAARQAEAIAESGAAPEQRSEAYLLVAAFEGLIAKDHRRNKLTKAGPARAAFKALKNAIVADPDSPRSWSRYGAAVLGMALAMQRSGAAHFFGGLVGLRPEREMERAIGGLRRFPDDPFAQVILVELLVAQNSNAPEELARVRARVEELRATHAQAVADAEKAAAGVRRGVEAATDQG